MQQGGEFFHEFLIAVVHPLYLVRVAVVGDDRRYGGEQTGGGCHQGLGDARRNQGQGRLLEVPQGMEGVHDAPHGAEQADIGAGGADGGEEGEIDLQAVHLAAQGDPHGAFSTLEDGHEVPVVALTQAHVFLEAGPKDGGQSVGPLPVLLQVPVEGVEVAAGPEALLEIVRGPPRLFQDPGTVEDHGPGDDRGQHQGGEHQLHHDTRVEYQVEEGKLSAHRRSPPAVFSAGAWDAGSFRPHR